MNHLSINNIASASYEINEAINRLHANLLFCGSEYKTIMVTSSIPDEGKSAISMQLWQRIANSGKKVCYIDADLRKSVMRSRHSMKTENKDPKGLTHYLSGQADISDILYETNIQNGYMLPVVRTTSNPTILLHNERFAELITVLRQNFDYIIIDTPPLDSVADGEIISAQCDGAILIVRSGVTHRSMIADSMKQLERAKCKLLGVVLNRARVGKGQYYYGSRRYGYGYYSKYYGSDNKENS